MKLFLVFLGGGTGSLMRYGIARLLKNYSLDFPWATFFANAISCFVLGFIVGQLVRLNHPTQYSLFFVSGLCGGFSTFSSFSYEILQFLQRGDWLKATIYIAVSVILCMLFILLGMKLGKA